MKRICILGATGSIGTQTLDVIRKEKEDFELVCVSANTNYKKIIDIINEFKPLYVAMMNENSYLKVRDYCINNDLKTQVYCGMDGLNYIVSVDEVDMVVTSVVGMVGLIPTLTAIKSGKDIALANKETLVTAGDIVKEEVKKNNVKLLPVDSEHGAIFQCLHCGKHEEVNKLLLTASGGPFRGKTIECLKNVKAENALKHPTWNMGRKISIDSATLMNKGLEVIEAHYLFDIDYDNIQVVVHPQSIVHSMVEFKDSSIIAQLGSTDMRLPIQYALNYPDRKTNIANTLDFYKMKELSFEKPDMDTFRCLKLAYEAGKIGGLMPSIINAANEVAVELFLNNIIGFLDIPNLIEECMLKFYEKTKVDLNSILKVDNDVRKYIKNKYRL